MPCIVARRWPSVTPDPPDPPDPPDTNQCVFDQIVSGRATAHVVLDEPDLLGFLDTHPLFAGHTLVIPRRHVGTIAELPPDLLGPLLEAGRRVAAAQRTALACDGTFFALNDVISQSVPHVHLHVVPRRRKDGLRGFLWPRTRYATTDEADEVATRLRDALPAPELP
jgi:histidine triad (HIT) family protein